MDDDMFILEDHDPDVLSLLKQYNNGNYTTSHLYKAWILNSIRDGTSNCSVMEGILDSLILIEKFDRKQNIPTSHAMRNAFRAVSVHCTLKYLPLSWSSFFDAVQRIWSLRIKNLEELGSSDLLSPDLARWRTEIEAALWNTETSQRLLHIGTLSEALSCIRIYLNEAFRSIKAALPQLAAVPTGENVDNAVSTSTQILSIPHRSTNDGNVDNDVSTSTQLLSSPHHGTNDGNVDNAVSTSTQLLSSPHRCTNDGNVDNAVSTSTQLLSSPHRGTKTGNVDNVASASAQVPSSPYPCTNEENGNLRENSHSSPRRHEGPVIIADSEEGQSSSSNYRTLPTSEVNEQLAIVLKTGTAGLQAGPADSLNEALDVAETVPSDMARENLHIEDPNKDMGDPTTSHCPTTHNCNGNGKQTMRASSQRYKLHSSRRRLKRPLIISDLEEVERVASDMGSENLHDKAIVEDSNKDRDGPTNSCTDKGKRILVNSQRCGPNSSPRHYEGPTVYADTVADRSSLSTPEIEKVRDSLKSSVADLLASVTDPLPKVLEVANRIASYVAAAKKLHDQGAEGDGNKEVGVLDEAISKDHDRVNGSVPAPSVDHMAEPSQAKEGNEAFIRPNKVRRTSIMEKNDTAHTFEWEDPVDGSFEGKGGCSNRCSDPIDGSAEGTNSSSNRCTLPNPKTKCVSPLKKNEPLKWVRKRKINRWTDEEEKALIEGVKKYGTQWRLILRIYEEVLGSRTQVDLKDKWRNLSRK